MAMSVCKPPSLFWSLTSFLNKYWDPSRGREVTIDRTTVPTARQNSTGEERECYQQARFIDLPKTKQFSSTRCEHYWDDCDQESRAQNTAPSQAHKSHVRRAGLRSVQAGLCPSLGWPYPTAPTIASANTCSRRMRLCKKEITLSLTALQLLELIFSVLQPLLDFFVLQKNKLNSNMGPLLCQFHSLANPFLGYRTVPQLNQRCDRVSFVALTCFWFWSYFLRRSS